MSYKKLFLLLCLGVFISQGRDANAQSQTFNYTGSLQTWTVPCATTVTITANGAQGGETGGLGARIVGTFTVVPYSVLDIIVGQQGLTGNGGNGGGGGGTYIWSAGNTTLPLAVAAGGGGYSTNGGSPPGPGSGTTTPTNGGGSGSGAGGTGGNGGVYGAKTGNGADATGGGGAGWLSNGGTNPGVYSEGEGQGGFYPLSIVTPGAGGIAGNASGAAGGYGGGGGSSGGSGASGGGGGYNGGGGGNAWSGSQWGSGGGGGSYNGGTNQTNTTGVQSGNGSVTITWVVSNIPVSVVGAIKNNVLCSGVNNGRVYGITTGVGLLYSWSPGGQTTDTATGLSAGTYKIVVTSQCGGSASAAITVTQPAQFVVNVSTTGNVVCNGQANGSASSTIVGGSAPYTYSWTPSGGNAATANGLTAGTYSLKVTDNNGCTGSGSVVITQPTALGVVISSQTNETCFGQKIGAASATPSGGTLPYTYAWSPNGSTTNSAVGLGAGVQNLDVWDLHGCTVSASVTITQPVPLAVGAGTVLNNRCYNHNIGIVVAYVSNGPAPYTYAWTPAGGNKDSAIGMSIGTYNVLVTDASGCIGTSSATVTQPSQVQVQLNSVLDDGACTGSAWLTVTGGISPYSYLWTDGNTTFMIANQCTGNYCCVVTDGNGCMTNTCIDITSDLGVGTVASGGGKIKVYPNPTSGMFTVNVSGVSGSAVIEVYDVLGAKVYSAALDMTNGGNTSVNMAGRANGIYLYRIISNANGNLLGAGKIALEK